MVIDKTFLTKAGIHMNKDYLKNYAKLPVHIGVQLEKGQKVIVMAAVEAVELTRLVVEECYKAGASEVFVYYRDQVNTHTAAALAPLDALENPPTFLYNAFADYASQDAAFISISSEDPSLMADIDPERLKTMSMAGRKVQEAFMPYIMNGIISWNVLAYPNAQWARKVFPDLPKEEALEALWDQIFSITRSDQEDPVAAWQEHIDTIVANREALNRHQFTALHYIGPGTDLEVGLPQGHIWKGAGHKRKDGRVYMANIPTEEVFTLPHKYRTNGTVTSTKPLSYNGQIIEDFKLTIKDGRIVDYTANKGEKALEDMISMDEGARYFGEVAIVPVDSPISNSGLTFYNTLYDENAACHLAVGSAYAHCLKDSAGMTDQEKDQAGVNTSMTHVDFMIGSKDVAIFGVKADGSKIQIIKDGQWTEALHQK